jgi:hypothetical protein
LEIRDKAQKTKKHNWKQHYVLKIKEIGCGLAKESPKQRPLSNVGQEGHAERRAHVPA